MSDGALIKGGFSVALNKKVCFSQGNLQFQASTNLWRFAEHQWDWIGDANKKISSTNSGWIDLFGWGTSGWISGANAYQPYSVSTDSKDYCIGSVQEIKSLGAAAIKIQKEFGEIPLNSYKNDMTGKFSNADWGVYNKISNGGNQAGMWRTLTSEEWKYLLYTRVKAANLIGLGTINNVKGLILLPDNWENTLSVKFKCTHNNYFSNVFSSEEWSVMESYGAVFLPLAGHRKGTEVFNVGSSGYYWSSSAYSRNKTCYHLWVDSYGFVFSENGNRSEGGAVRLVQDIK
jgi:hypothetical protein